MSSASQYPPPSGKEQRRYTRILAEFPVTCTSGADDHGSFEALSQDYSVGGIQLLTPKPLSPGVRIELRFAFWLSRHLRYRARVCWALPASNGYRLGCKFDA